MFTFGPFILGNQLNFTGWVSEIYNRVSDCSLHQVCIFSMTVEPWPRINHFLE